VFDHKAENRVASIVIKAVAVITASRGSPASDKIKPLTGTIYNIVKNVVNPA
jgi:hypothetical protein